MKTQPANLRRSIVFEKSLSSDREGFKTLLQGWRNKLRFLSLLATIPTVLVSQVFKARAEEATKPDPNVAGLPARLRQRLNRSRSNIELLKRQSEFSLPQPGGNFVVTAAFAGTDDCPGRPVLRGTYTAASPYLDSGDTTGANDTVSRAYYQYYTYYNYDTFGGDQVYSFSISGFGPNPRIEVSSSSGTYRPLIYILQSGAAQRCPAGTGNHALNMLILDNSRWRAGSNTATLDANQMTQLPLNIPLYLFVDSASNDPMGSGPYTVRIQDLTIGPSLTCSASNPIDCTDFFVRQHYLDFLGREPDEAGYDGWQNILNNCGVTVAQPCDRIEVSSAFFRSPEFQGRGYFVYRFFSAIGKVPTYEEFGVGAGLRGFLTEQQLEAAKTAFANGFVNRPDFQNKYNSALGNPVTYVDALLQTVGLPNHPSRQNWINFLNGGNNVQTRAQVLRALVESNEVYQKYYNEAFVVMQYFGFLHRTADAHYLDWVQTMNQNGGDYRVMINGFLNSAEYRQRFVP